MPETFFTDSVTVEWAPASEPFDETPTWVTLSNVWSVSITRGRSGSLDTFPVGKCTIVVDNPTGTIDPTEWYRWRQVRVTATATGPTSNVLFRGFVEDIAHDQGGRPGFAKAEIRAVDLSAIFAYDVIFTDNQPGALTVQLSGERVQGSLDYSNIPAAWTDVASGYVNIAGLDPGSHDSLKHLQDVAQAEGGAFYVTADGVITFADRYSQLDKLTDSPSAVFSDTYSGSDVAFLYGDVILTPPGREYRDKISITGDTGNPQETATPPSGFPFSTLARTLPIDSDTEALQLAELLFEAYSQTGVIWPEHLTVSVFSQTILDEITPLDLRDYCDVEFTPAGETQQTYKVFIESIDHTISDVSWTVRFGFSSADRWEAAWGLGTDYLIIGDATYGLIGTGKIGPH